MFRIQRPLLSRHPLLLLACLLILPPLCYSNSEALQKTPSVRVQSLGNTPQNVILISWDGLDRSVVKELLKKKELPNLAKLAKEGSLQEIEVQGHATCTKPGHAEMLTGLSPETTGVYTNGKYQPILEGFTIFEQIQNLLGKNNIHTFMVTGKLAHVGARGPGEIPLKKKAKKAAVSKKQSRKAAKAKIPKEARLSAKKGEPFYLTQKHLDVFDGGQRDASVVGPLCLKYLEQFKEPRFLAFLHFSDPDHAGHKFGSGSRQYRQAAMTCDEWLGRIVQWLKDKNLYSQTLIYVTTDHGFDPNARTHRNAPHSWLVTNDKGVARGGTLADIPATILTRFGMNVPQLEPALTGKPLVRTTRSTQARFAPSWYNY